MTSAPIIFTDDVGDEWVVKTEAAETEVAVYELARQLFGGVVPETRMISWRGREASAQRVVEGKTAHETGRALFSIARNPQPQQAIANIVCMDYMLGNRDRHGNNWIVDRETVWAIDNGNAFDSGVNFRNALRIAERCLMVDDCTHTPPFIDRIEAILLSLPKDDLTSMIPDWSRRLRDGLHALNVWRAELEDVCQTKA